MKSNKNPSFAYLFDVDGVITDPKEKKITEDRLLDMLAEKLESNLPVTLNTGRSNEWMIERVINPLTIRLEDKSVLKNFFAVGEKGLTWASFNENLMQGVFNKTGGQVRGFDISVFLDRDTVRHFETLKNEVKKLIKGQYSHSTFFDDTKKAMISAEMNDGYHQPDYHKEQSGFVRAIEILLENHSLRDKFRIDPSTISTDIQIPEAGKHLGARHIMDWLKSRNINPAHFITIGDSVSDLEMADELYSQGRSVEFWYVNPSKPLDLTKPYPVKVSTKEFSAGTVEMLASEK